jgi:hypothetical protein
MRDWSSLAPDLIRHVGDLLLATNDVDGYMDMRAVCNGWRSAVADPRAHSSAADLGFCPRQWFMLDNDDNNAEGRLFVNVSGSRCFVATLSSAPPTASSSSRTCAPLAPIASSTP